MPINITQVIAFLPDLILIFISGTACLYCYLLNRRLTKLNNLDTGLGATIVTLTRAIENTYKAAQDAQSSTQDAVDTLNELLKKSSEALPEAERLSEALDRSYERARDRQELLEYSIEVSLEKAVSRAESTANELLKAVAEIKKKDFAAAITRTAQIPPTNTPTVQPLKRKPAS